MAEVKISQFPSASALTGSEVLPIVQGGSTLGATVNQIKDKIQSSTINVLKMNASSVQTLANIGELAFNRIHELNGTVEQKAAYHALVASIMAKLTGGDMLSSAGSAAINNLNFAPLKRRKTSIKSREIQPFSFALCTILSDFPPDCR